MTASSFNTWAGSHCPLPAGSNLSRDGTTDGWKDAWAMGSGADALLGLVVVQEVMGGRQRHHETSVLTGSQKATGSTTGV